MALAQHRTTPRIIQTTTDGYLWVDGGHDRRTTLDDGYQQYKITGLHRGDDLHVWRGREYINAELPLSVQTHEDAIAYCRAELGEPRKAVTL